MMKAVERIPQSLIKGMKKVGTKELHRLLSYKIRQFGDHAVLNCGSISKNEENLVKKGFTLVSSDNTDLQSNLRHVWINQRVNEVNKIESPSAILPSRQRSFQVNYSRLLDNVGAQRLGMRQFSTTTQVQKKNSDIKDCKRKGGGLPCLKATGLSAETKKSSKNCEKFCMPCCAPARDPPDCIVAQKKRECKRLRPPRPAYSECKKNPMKLIKPCECLIGKLPPCNAEVRKGADKGC